MISCGDEKEKNETALLTSGIVSSFVKVWYSGVCVIQNLKITCFIPNILYEKL